MARTDAWTREADDLLCSEWGMWPDAVIARWLGRTPRACQARAEVLGVRKRDNLARAARAGVGKQREEAA